MLTAIVDSQLVITDSGQEKQTNEDGYAGRNRYLKHLQGRGAEERRGEEEEEPSDSKGGRGGWGGGEERRREAQSWGWGVQKSLLKGGGLDLSLFDLRCCFEMLEFA